MCENYMGSLTMCQYIWIGKMRFFRCRTAVWRKVCGLSFVMIND